MAVLPLVLLGVCLAAGALLALELAGGAGKRRLAGRARRMSRVDSVKRRPEVEQRLRLDAGNALDALVHRLVPRAAALKTRLGASGTGMTVSRYATISGGLAAAVAVLAMLRGLSPLPAILLGLLAGLTLPWMAIGSLVKKRQKAFFKLFPESIGLIVRGLKAGLPVSETLQVVGRETADPVGEEFRRVSDQVRLGQSVEEAMWAVARRLDLPEFNFLVITLSVQRETGGNLAETLENLEDILRKRQQMRLKVKAMSSEATASAGIIGSLPFVMAGMMFLASRGYIMSLFSSGLGWMMIAGGAASLLMGVVVMAKMVSFDI